MIYAILVLSHIAISCLCAYLYIRKCKKLGIEPDSAGQRLTMALFGGWIIVPELWDNSWLDKYGIDENE